MSAQQHQYSHKQSIYFFPKNITFWIYHCTGCIAILASDFTTNLYHQGNIYQNLLYNSHRIAILSIAVLFLRYCYIKWGWQYLDVKRTILFIFLFSILTSIIAAIAMLFTTQSFIWDVDIEHWPDSDPIKLGIDIVISFIFGFQPFICAWGFIYSYIKTNITKQAIETSNLRLQNSLKEAQLHSLANQVNPHFLFNALNNIRFMMQENVQHADKMIVYLSEILRYSLETSKQEKVTFAQELEVIHSYISLMKIQFEQRLIFTLKTEKKFEHCFIPPMLLQMLVENAIKHGIDNIRNGGKLDITAIRENNKLIIHVSNDISLNPHKNNHHTGIGLTNIRKRIALLYGDQAHLSTNIINEQFIASLELPMEIKA